MNPEIKKAIKTLIDFAEDHAEEVYGDNETEYPGSTQNVLEINKAISIIKENINYLEIKNYIKLLDKIDRIYWKLLHSCLFCDFIPKYCQSDSH